MESQIWLRSQEKRADILMLRGNEVYLLKVTGISLTLKRKVQGVVDALQEGKGPENVGGKLTGSLDARTIGKAEVSPATAR